MIKAKLKSFCEMCRLSYRQVSIGFPVVAGLFTIIFFTSLLDSGMPQQLPIAVVDQDQTSTTSALQQRLSNFQSTKIVANFSSLSEARIAMQKGEIYGYILFPNRFTEDLLSGRQPDISFYYNSAIFTGGVLAMKDLKTISVIANAAVGQATLQAKGLTEDQIMSILQPVLIQGHLTGNPWANYNIYISTMVVPGVIILLVTLLLCYYLPKVGRAVQNAFMMGLFLFIFQLYLYGILRLPHEGSWLLILFLTLILVGAAMGFAFFIFALIPSRRMSMSICSLWGVMSFSMSGAAYPVDMMHPLLQALSYLFPLRHYFMAYQMNVLHGYSIAFSWIHISALILFSALPLLVWGRLKYQIRSFVYTD
ncbi:MAG: ABC transporter permease [Marinilabiliaceae bacterium]|nr:ABC transporter permease [Marinilabiliaceae bacterium]